MSLLKINNLSMAFGGQDVFSGLNAQINKSDHIGLVGPNGVGKTTLLRIILGELYPVSGHSIGQPGLRIGYLPQNPEYHPEQTVYNEVYAGLSELMSVESELSHLESEIKKLEGISPSENNTNQINSSNQINGHRNGVNGIDKSLDILYNRYAELTDRFELLGGSTAEARIKSLLNGLGIPHRLWHSRMDTLSGGERNMVGLARILIDDYDLMLLDEPGNHLDFSGLEWLENFLRTSQKAFIIVSHNRYMLDRVCEKVWELERGKLTEYTGNYSDYRHDKLTRELAQEAAYKRAQKDINRLKFNIQRLKAWSSVYDNPKLAKTAKAFERRVENLEKIDRPAGEGKKLRFRFLTKPSRGKIALEAKGYRKQFDEAPVLLENVDFLITQGERVAFVGDNGTGKTSLLKDTIEYGGWENPNLRVGKSVSVGYFSQLGENLDLKTSIIEDTMRMTGLLRGTAADLLHRFLFKRDDLEKPVKVLSGGEKARMQLAVLLHSSADMLLLDEPTNHLDIHSREAVEDALEEYPGTLILVSHDRYFLDKLADRILHFVPPDVRPYDGNFSEFWDKYKHQYQSTSKQVSKVAGKQGGKKNRSIKFDSKRFRELEIEIKHLEKLRIEVESEFNNLIKKGKETRAQSRRIRLVKIDRTLEELYDEWLVLGEKKKKW
ncbi:MAG: ABC-F family ATP-binding cassette domain-containing protein [Candidatus Hatepunaea meridiana]|nr:ABC-F family ATP-binding cassette domain-containing protein [Candidatus Hatepunaea meridiana]